jgi:hypothetical protein
MVVANVPLIVPPLRNILNRPVKNPVVGDVRVVTDESLLNPSAEGLRALRDAEVRRRGRRLRDDREERQVAGVVLRLRRSRRDAVPDPEPPERGKSR